MELGKGEEIQWNDYSGAMNHMFSSFIDSIILYDLPFLFTFISSILISP